METTVTKIFIFLLFLALPLSIFLFAGPLFILAATIGYSFYIGLDTISPLTLAAVIILALTTAAADWFFFAGRVASFPLTTRDFLLVILGATAGALALGSILLGFGILSGAFLGAQVAMVFINGYKTGKLKRTFRNYGAVFLGLLGGLSRGFVSLVMIAFLLNRVYS